MAVDMLAATLFSSNRGAETILASHLSPQDVHATHAHAQKIHICFVDTEVALLMEVLSVCCL